MPYLIAALWGAFLSILPSIIGRILVAIGISAITYTGFSLALDSYKSDIFSALGATSPTILQVMGVLNVGTAINILFSAMAARAAYEGYSASKTVLKWPSLPKS